MTETFTPLKVVCQVVGVHRNSEGEVISEAALDPFPIYPADFGKFGELIEQQWPQVVETYFEQRNGSQSGAWEGGARAAESPTRAGTPDSPKPRRAGG